MQALRLARRFLVLTLAAPGVFAGSAAGGAAALPVVVAQETSVPPGEAQLDGEEAESAAEAGRTEVVRLQSEQAALVERVRALLGAVDDFAGIEAGVEGGIVVLSGSAASREAAERAAATVEQLDGVLLVVDDVTVRRDVGDRLGASWASLLERGREAVGALPLFIVAVGLLFLAWLLAELLRRAAPRGRWFGDHTLLESFVRRTLYAGVLVAGLVAALRLLDAGGVIGTILGAAGVFGIALGFAFRNIVENYLAGFLLAVRRPFGARDIVEIDGLGGTVLRMTSSETLLLDEDGNHLRLPNATVFNGVVRNFTRNPLRRFTVAVGVSNETALDDAQDLGIATLCRMKGVVEEPAPSSRVAALGTSTVQLEFFGWVDQRAAGFIKVESEAHRLVKEAFDDAGVEMPAPEYRVELGGASPAAGPTRPAPRPAPGPAPEEIEVSPASDIDGQVDAELARKDSDDLL